MLLLFTLNFLYFFRAINVLKLVNLYYYWTLDFRQTTGHTPLPPVDVVVVHKAVVRIQNADKVTAEVAVGRSQPIACSIIVHTAL